MKRIVAASGVSIAAVLALAVLWRSLAPDTDISEHYVEVVESELRIPSLRTPTTAAPAPAHTPPTDQPAPVEQLRAALDESPFPSDGTRVRMRTVSLPVPIPPQPEYPPDLEPGEKRDGMRRPHPDDPPYLPPTDEEFQAWRDEFVQSVARVAVACGGGRHEVICDTQACAFKPIDGQYSWWTAHFRRPSMIPEKIGRMMGLPDEVDRCLHGRNRFVHFAFRDSIADFSDAPGCNWAAPGTAFEHHDNWVGRVHGQTLCEVLD